MPEAPTQRSKTGSNTSAVKPSADAQALAEENARLKQKMQETTSPRRWREEQAETLKLEKLAEREKVRTGEVKPLAPEPDPIQSALLVDMPVADRVNLWLKALDEMEWGEKPEASLVQAVDLLVYYRLRPEQPHGQKKDGQKPTLRTVLLERIAESEEDIVEVGEDGKANLTDLGEFFYKTVSERFGTAAIGLPDIAEGKKPDWQIPCENITQPARELFDRMSLAEPPTVFRQGKVMVEMVPGDQNKPVLEEVSANRLISLAEDFVRPFVYTEKNVKVYRRMRESDARPLLEIHRELAKLPSLNVLANAPVLVETGDGKTEIIKPGYHKATGIYVTGGSVDECGSIKESAEILQMAFAEFKFATDADFARNMGLLITPALVLGDLLGERSAVDISEADLSQAGKGLRQKLIAAYYNDVLCDIAQPERGGVGSLEESFDTALIHGNHFIRLDNYRGELKSQKIEAFLTSDSYIARAPYFTGRSINPSRRMVYISSNGMAMTSDMANRSCIVRIRKQERTAFCDALAIVRSQQGGLLGCVFAIVSEWVRRGKPRTDETGHDFRTWVQAVDWIVRELFDLPPIMQGHHDLQCRISSLYMTWLRSTAVAVERAGSLEQTLSARDLIEICEASDVEVPNRRKGEEMDAARHLGRVMSQIFDKAPVVVVDEYRVHRIEVEPTQGIHHVTKTYRFEKTGKP